MLTKKTNKAPAPSGLLTTMFTDIVGSTQLKSAVAGETSARRDTAYRTEIKGPHDAVVLTCIQEYEGYVINSTGDGYCVTFVDAEEAVLCALQVQERLRVNPIPTPLGPLQVRIGLHTGMTGATGGDYTAVTLDKTARVQSQAQGGQVFISRETHALVAGKMQGITFETAGTFDLKGLGADGLYRVALIPALPPDQTGAAVKSRPFSSAPVQAERPKRRTAKRPPIFWLAAALTAALLAVLGYFLRARIAPLSPLLPTGSVWAGSFRFLPPIQNYGGSADLSITQRTGDRFEGVYATENRKYQWRVNGTDHGDHLRWEFTQVLQSPGTEDAVGKAYVEATVKGDQITGLFHEYNNPGEVAALQLRRSK